MSKSNLNKQEKLKINALLSDLRSKDEVKIASAIKAFAVHGHATVIEPIIEVWRSGLSAENEALVMSMVQKPLAARAFTDKSAQPAWRVKPCWYQISTQDRMLPVETQRDFAARIQAQKVIGDD